MPHVTDRAGAQRRPSTIIDENEPLLAAGGGSNLYRTISHESRNYNAQSNAIDEESSNGELERTLTTDKAPGVWVTLSVMLVGVFISNADWTFVLATYSTVASEFNDLSAGSWMLSAFILAQGAVQPLYGKLSDIYGRKSCLQVSYLFFTLGTAGCGLARSMPMVIAFRAIQGGGGAGMVSLTSIIITDLVPMHEVAALRSYVNILQTVGRGAGGVIGGLLTERIGWRWAFLCQVPFMIFAILLVQWRLNVPVKYGARNLTKWEKLKRIDFFGAFSLSVTVLGLCAILEIGGSKVAWDSPLIFVFAGISVVAGAAFVFNASRVAEPIFPLRLIAHFDVLTNYLISLLQVIIQMSLMLVVPLYWQATKKASPAESGLYLLPAFIGNTLGGLFSGYWIKHTGSFKLPTVLGPILGILCMLLCLLGTHGRGNGWKSIFIFPGGFGMGLVSSSTFVGLAASVPEEDVAIAGSGMYLCVNLGGLAGTALGAAVFQGTLRNHLPATLTGVKHGAQIAEKLLEDMDYLLALSDDVWRRVVPAYVDAFHAQNIMGLSAGVVSLVIALISRRKRLSTG